MTRNTIVSDADVKTSDKGKLTIVFGEKIYALFGVRISLLAH